MARLPLSLRPPLVQCEAAMPSPLLVLSFATDGFKPRRDYGVDWCALLQPPDRKRGPVVGRPVQRTEKNLACWHRTGVRRVRRLQRR